MSDRILIYSLLVGLLVGLVALKRYDDTRRHALQGAVGVHAAHIERAQHLAALQATAAAMRTAAATPAGIAAQRADNGDAALATFITNHQGLRGAWFVSEVVLDRTEAKLRDAGVDLAELPARPTAPPPFDRLLRRDERRRSD